MKHATVDRGGRHFKTLFRKLEDAVSQIEKIENPSRMLEKILTILLEQFADELGFEGGRIYRVEGGEAVLCCGFGTSRDVRIGLRVSADYPPHRRLVEEGIVVMRRDDSGVDPSFEDSIGVGSRFAAIGVGDGPEHIIAFSVRGEPPEEDLLYTLSLVRHVVNLRMQQQHVTGVIEATRLAHESILPRTPPAFGGFDISGTMRPSDLVSGDLFDYVAVSDCCLGITIADSCGHGLPAALLARDAITGLRMGAGRGQDVAEIVQRLNEVIHRAARAGTFVSLFYGQLSDDGALDYCNAGHEPPMLVRGASISTLDRGGTVLGPIRDARYESGRVRLEPGDLLVLYTDGIVEREDRAGRPYGPERLRSLLPGLAREAAGRVVEAVLGDVDAFARGVRAEDDMTVMAVRRH